MNQVLGHLRPLLRPGGAFAACWGPMWYSYSGDHIAAELGMKFGFEHVRLSANDYFEWYRKHPRNREAVLRGQATWLELGLHNYWRYRDYLSAITQLFGPPAWVQWQISSEAFEYQRRFGETWRKMLAMNPNLRPLDLVLGGAAVICGPDTREQ